MSSSARLRLVDPGSLPNVWRAPELGRVVEPVVSTGHAALDAQLPGGGWPVGSLVEVLQQRPEQHVWQLLLPGLAQAIAGKPGPIVLVGAPFEPFGPSISAQGVPGHRLLCIKADKPAMRLWACEQSLRCADVVGVLAWLPQAKGAELRRLHLAAQQHGKLLFAFRPLTAQRDASPARVRLRVEGVDAMQVHLLKRRGPPLETPLVLPAQSPRVAALLEARRRRSAAPSSPPVRQGQGSHVLDRTVAPA
jgi:protein ImuA